VSSEPQAKFAGVRRQDLPVLLGMMRRLAEHPPAIPFDEEELRAPLEKFLAHPELGRAWLVQHEEKAVGYVILTLGYSFEYRGVDAFIDELYVEAQWRRRGFGRQAMEYVEAQARALGVNALHLEVDRGNDAAIELYRRAGYEDHGRHLMTRWLIKQRGRTPAR
jgi:ribosomal protein S18 acetylase RimI-like enzyme